MNFSMYEEEQNDMFSNKYKPNERDFVAWIAFFVSSIPSIKSCRRVVSHWGALVYIIVWISAESPSNWQIFAPCDYLRIRSYSTNIIKMSHWTINFKEWWAVSSFHWMNFWMSECELWTVVVRVNVTMGRSEA